jgi:hypothetical protein
MKDFIKKKRPRCLGGGAIFVCNPILLQSVQVHSANYVKMKADIKLDCEDLCLHGPIVMKLDIYVSWLQIPCNNMSVSVLLFFRSLQGNGLTMYPSFWSY